MPDIAQPREVTKQEHLRQLAKYFKEPGQIEPNDHVWQMLEKLYEIGQFFDSANPVGWIIDFNRSYPILLEVGAHKDRLSNIFAMAEIKQKQFKEEVAERASLEKKKRAEVDKVLAAETKQVDGAV